MTTLELFFLQFLWFLVAWAALASLVVHPLIQHLERRDRLCIWIAPHLFRVLGVGLLVPELSPGMPRSFALPTAIGDGATAALALAALIALRGQWRHALVLVWAFNVFGSADLIVASAHAARIQAATYLDAQWYVAALGIPLMLVAHYRVFRELLQRDAPPRPSA